MRGSKPGVFISHSSTTVEQSELLDRLEADLRADGFEVYLDRSARDQVAGFEYEAPMLAHLDWCVAAVILVTPSALDVGRSGWVHQETSRLMHRKDSEPGLQVVPVFAGTSSGDLKRPPWLETKLGKQQGFRSAEANLIGKILDTLRPAREEWELGQRVSLIHSALTSCIQQLPIETQRQALAAMEVEVLPFRPDQARMLTNALLQEREPDRVAAAAKVIAAYSVDLAAKVLDLALPFACIGDAQAAWLRGIVAGRRGAAIERKQDDVCWMLVRRACQEEPPEWTYFPAASLTGDDQAQRLIVAVREHLRWLYCDSEMSDDELRAALRRQPCVVALPPGPFPSDVLEPVRAFFPGVSLFLRAVGPAEILGLDFVSFVEPPLEAELVGRALAARQDFRGSVRSLKGMLL